MSIIYGMKRNNIFFIVTKLLFLVKGATGQFFSKTRLVEYDLYRRRIVSRRKRQCLQNNAAQFGKIRHMAILGKTVSSPRCSMGGGNAMKSVSGRNGVTHKTCQRGIQPMTRRVGKSAAGVPVKFEGTPKLMSFPAPPCNKMRFGYNGVHW